MNAIQTRGNILMVILPWNNPIPLTRAWCVFELYACERTNSCFEVSTPPSERKRFLDGMAGNVRAFNNTLAAIKSVNSKSFLPTDRERIFEVIKEEVGFPLLEALVLRVFEKWMVCSLKEQVELAVDSGDEAELVRWKSALGDLHFQMGDYSPAERLFRESYAMAQSRFGEDHRKTLDVMNGLALTCEALGKYKEAEKLFSDVLNGTRRGGDENFDLPSMNSLAMLYEEMGK